MLSQGLRHFATRFPLTRPFVRSYARSLFDLCAGFVYSQILLAGVRLRLFDHLAQGPQSITVLAERIALSQEATERLVLACVSLGLLRRSGKDRFALAPLGSALVGNRGLESLIEHHSLLYADLHDPVALLRGERQSAALSDYWPYSRAEDPAAITQPRVAAYTTLMSASQPMIADEILDAYSLASHKCLLDVGGGAGQFLAKAAVRYPELRLMLFDLPAVTQHARSFLEDCGLAGRTSIIGGDFLKQPLPAGSDAVSLVRIVHDHDDEAVFLLFRAIRKILPKDGVLLLAEPLAETKGAETMGDAYFGFYLLAMGRGKVRSSQRLTDMLKSSGFSRVKQIGTRLPLQTSLILAYP